MAQIIHLFVEFQKEEIEQSIPKRFEQQVNKYPGNFAIKTGTLQLTYAEFNRLANQVAHTILARTDRRNARAALILEQSGLQIAALLGALKAGCVTVPIDIHYPPDRINSMIQDCEPEIVITNNQNLGIVSRLSNAVPLINMDRLNTQASDNNPQTDIAPGDLSFLVYTSGTTGEPKGIMQTHRNILRNARAYINSFHISHADRIPLFASLSTGQGIAAAFCTLLSGATLYPYSIRENGIHDLTAFLFREKITCLMTACTVFRQFVETLTGNEEFPDLRLIRLAGEPLTRMDFELYQKHFAEYSVLVNAFSATEAGNIAEYLMDKNTKITGNTVPIGFPVECVEVMLLDNRGKDVEFDSIGEIAVKGRYLSPGYWRKPDLTKQVFRSVMDSDARIYLTGDLGRRTRNGCLEHSGRKDFQVKIRGFRIEVEEIEAQLNRHKAVRAAAVCVIQEMENRLVAYIAPQHGHNPTVRQLVDHLKQGLPDYMIPSEFRIVDAMPVTPGGKVDRNALMRSAATSAELGQSYVPWRDSVEEKLVAIWTEVLQRKLIGVEDRFFEIGGHSLSAMQILSRTRSQFGVEISVHEFFDRMTISDQARLIRQKIQTKMPPIERVSRNEQLPLSFSQQRLVFLYLLDPESSRYNIARAYHIFGSLNTIALEKALTEVFRRHELLRTIYPLEYGVPRQTITAPEAVKIQSIDLTGLPPRERESQALALLEEKASHPFNLELGPVFRAVLIRLERNDHIFLTAMHHITTDIWSRRIFFKELISLYDSFLNGETLKLPGLPIQYVDYAAWEHRRMQGEYLQKLLSYWRKKLSGVSQLRLPTDRSRPEFLSPQAKTQTSVISPALRTRLQWLSEQQGVTSFMTLLAAFFSFLRKVSGQEDIAIGTPITHRNFLEIENVIGFFVNTLVLRCDLSGDPTFKAVLAQIRETTVEAYAHQDLPFEKLVQDLNPKRSSNLTPLFQIMFVFDNVPEDTVTLPNLVVKPIELETRTAMFDLMVTISEKENGLQTFWKYSTDLFNDSTISQWITFFHTMVESMVADPDQPLSHLWQQ